MRIGQCYICGQKGPVAGHHVWMQSSGGKEGPVVDLDARCHDLIHRQASNIESKAEKIMLFTPQEWVKAKRLVEYIVLAIRKNKENPDFNDPYPLQIKLQKRDVYLLHRIKEEAGYSNLDTFMRDLIRAYIRSKFPQA